MGYYLISTTSVSEFIAAMEKLKVSYKIIIPFSVVFRFFPTVKEEYISIQNAMKIKGVTIRKSPIEMIEYRLVPLLISVTKIGEELSASALTRGLELRLKELIFAKSD
ncbi:energy-coupling factor transporter transmembrane component T [Caviibacter abscessus]|uniref:energy-coupling factor transporter transmembrane component T n=1 Tax=Caviibacter abscessus TaxID=1766719 RepID=UPI000B3402AC|nr:energy-coupling factor transporter transmembrane component T [Caviibacter abscessus]